MFVNLSKSCFWPMQVSKELSLLLREKLHSYQLSLAYSKLSQLSQLFWRCTCSGWGRITNMITLSKLKNRWQFWGQAKQKQKSLCYKNKSKCFVVVVSSFQLLNGFQWDRVPSILPMRTKSQGNEVILSTYYHSNLIRTTPLLIEFLLSKFKTKNQLS